MYWLNAFWTKLYVWPRACLVKIAAPWLKFGPPERAIRASKWSGVGTKADFFMSCSFEIKG
jgi:hypothetical protein